MHQVMQYLRYMTLEDFRSQMFNVSGTGSSIGTTTGHNFHIKTNNQYRLSITDQGAISLLGTTTAPRFVASNNSHLLTMGHWSGAI